MTLYILAMAFALAVLPITAHAQSPAVTAPKAAQPPTPEQLRALVEQAAVREAQQGSAARRIGDLHASFMETARIDTVGLTVLREDLDHIAQATSKQDLAELYGQGNFIYVPFRVDVRADPNRARQHAVAVSQSGLDLHEREPYVATDPRSVEVREKFVMFLAKMLALVDATDSRARAEKILAFETAIAQASRPRDQENDDKGQTRAWTQAELTAHAPGFDWGAYFASNGVPAQTPLLVSQPDVVRDVAKVLEQTELDVLKDHLVFSLICTWGWAGTLPQSVYDLQFDFYGRVRRGATEQPDRGKRAYDFVRRTLPADLERLAQGAEAANVATDGPEIRRDDVYGNAKRAHAWNWQRQLARLRPPALGRDAPAPPASKER